MLLTIEVAKNAANPPPRRHNNLALNMYCKKILQCLEFLLSFTISNNFIFFN
jgi:hypothetical protein